MQNSDFQFVQLILLAAFVVPAIFFLLTQYKTLNSVRPENRSMRPWLVWLQLIPFFGLFWGFFVVIHIARSAYRQRLTYNEESIIGLSPADVDGLGKRPTLAIGITWCILWIVDFPLPFLAKMSPGVQVLHILLTLAQITCWIIYWVQLGSLYRKIRRRSLATVNL